MYYKIFLPILLILAVISTMFICMFRPQMHKSILVYSSEFKIVPQTEIEIEVQSIPTLNQNETVKAKSVNIISFNDFDNDAENSYQATVVNQQVTPQNVNFNTQTTNIPQNIKFNTQNISTQGTNAQTTKIKQTTSTTKATSTTPMTQTTTVNIPKANTTTPTVKVNSPQIDIQKILDNNKKIQSANQQLATKPVAQTPVQTTSSNNKTSQNPVIIKTTSPVTNTTTVTPKPAQTTTTTVKPVAAVKTTPTQTVKVLTPQEEEIAWQVWRSNLQNKIMQDVKLPNVPQGTTFKFSFDVDKYGKITNVHTTSTNSAYTPYAIQYIAPVIKSYQGRSILNFPTGSKRTTTEFIGSFRINNTSNKYSTTQDYNDTERIIK